MRTLEIHGNNEDHTSQDSPPTSRKTEAHPLPTRRPRALPVQFTRPPSASTYGPAPTVVNSWPSLFHPYIPPPLLDNYFFFLRFFFKGTIFKVFTEFVTILFLFNVLVFWLRGMWDLSSPGIKLAAPALEGEVLTTGEPGMSLDNYFFFKLIYLFYLFIFGCIGSLLL